MADPITVKLSESHVALSVAKIHGFESGLVLTEYFAELRIFATRTPYSLLVSCEDEKFWIYTGK